MESDNVLNLYQNSLLIPEIMKQMERFKTNCAFIVFSDVDDTLLKNYISVEQDVLGTIQVSNEELVRRNIKFYDSQTRDVLSYSKKWSVPIFPVTGRGYEDLQRLFRKRQIEYHDHFKILITAVGTEIYILQYDGSYAKDLGFETFIKDEIGFIRSEIYMVAKTIKSIIQEKFPHVNFRFQPRDDEENIMAWKLHPRNARQLGFTDQDEPHTYKISFHFEGSEYLAQQLQKTLVDLLVLHGFPMVRVVVSHDMKISSISNQYNIDLLPISKAGAINYVINQVNKVLKQKIAQDDGINRVSSIAFGNAGNDIDMILYGGFLGGLVLDATEELKKRLAILPRRGGIRLSKLVVDQAIRRVYIGKSEGPRSLRDFADEVGPLLRRLDSIQMRRTSRS